VSDGVVTEDPEYLLLLVTVMVWVTPLLNAYTFIHLFTDVPTVVLDKNAYTVGYGDPVTMKCTITSNPTHTSEEMNTLRNLNVKEHKRNHLKLCTR
jgi:hypothetical protein